MSTTTITEDEFLAFAKKAIAEITPQFPELRDISFLSLSGSGITLFAYQGPEGYETITGNGATIAEAVIALRKQIPLPAERAKQLREEAAAKMAEAEKLCPVFEPRP